MWAGVFPGQGSQHPGMGQFLFENFEEAKHTFEEASDTLSLDFKKLCFEGSEEDLALTQNTQPCLLLVSTATHQVLKKQFNLELKAAAGHSIGEYAAVVAAGSMNFADAIRAVRKRGEAMQSAVPVGKGGMLAVMGLDTEQTNKLCEWTMEKSGQSPLEPANYNAPGQIVVSGSQAAIDWLNENLDKTIFDPPPRRLKLIPLKVSAPFHCSMMKPAEEVMDSTLNELEFKEAAFPIVQNVVAKPVASGDELRRNLITQVSAPVRWVECIEQIRDLGHNQLIEIGAGKVVSGLVKKIDSENLTTLNINSLDDLKALEEKL